MKVRSLFATAFAAYTKTVILSCFGLFSSFAKPRLTLVPSNRSTDMTPLSSSVISIESCFFFIPKFYELNFLNSDPSPRLHYVTPPKLCLRLTKIRSTVTISKSLRTIEHALVYTQYQRIPSNVGIKHNIH